MKIELEPGRWLANGTASLPKASDKRRAREFTTMTEVMDALRHARTFRPYPNATVTDWTADYE